MGNTNYKTFPFTIDIYKFKSIYMKSSTTCRNLTPSSLNDFSVNYYIYGNTSPTIEIKIMYQASWKWALFAQITIS